MHLELGGKAPVIVFDDADLEALVATLTETGYYNSGQDCTAPCRVHRRARACSTTSSPASPTRSARSTTGDPFDDDTAMGPVDLGRPARPRRGHGRPGASRPAPRSRPAAARSTGAGFFYEPSVVVNPAQDSEIVQREVFGPVVTVQRFTDEDAGARVGQRRRLRPRGERVDQRRRPRDAHGRARCSSARVWVNDHIPIVSEMPHGGFKQSGYGKDMSIYAIEHYTELKHVMVKH